MGSLFPEDAAPTVPETVTTLHLYSTERHRVHLGAERPIRSVTPRLIGLPAERLLAAGADLPLAISSGPKLSGAPYLTHKQLAPVPPTGLVR
jgi:hypothetical protein